jgi:hypothetical protein
MLVFSGMWKKQDDLVTKWGNNEIKSSLQNFKFAAVVHAVF